MFPYKVVVNKIGLILLSIFSQEHIEILAGKDGELIFFKQRDGPWYPTLRLLHKCKFSETVEWQAESQFIY